MNQPEKKFIDLPVGLIHHLKIETPYLVALLNGTKKAEARLNDRGYQAGQFVSFPVKDEEIVIFKITHVLPGNPRFGIDVEFCVLSVEFLGFASRRNKALNPKIQLPQES